MNENLTLLLKAASFAAEKHRTQLRKSAEQTPYINHPLEVAKILSEMGGVDDVEVLAAAILHDTVEDTKTSLDELEGEFGPVVTALVAEVTDDKSIPKPERKRLQVVNAANKSPGAALIKLADKIANVRDVGANPPSHWSFERRMAYLDWATEVVEALPNKNAALYDGFKRSLDEAKKWISQTQQQSITVQTAIDPPKNSGANQVGLPLLKIFFAYVFIVPTIWYALNFALYPPRAPSPRGIGLVLASYYGGAFGLSIWAFAPVWGYRLYQRLRKRVAAREQELWLCMVGLVLTIIGLKQNGVF